MRTDDASQLLQPPVGHVGLEAGDAHGPCGLTVTTQERGTDAQGARDVLLVIDREAATANEREVGQQGVNVRDGGALDVSATYEFEPDEVRVTMEGRTDAPTVVNMVHHSYFNLGGHDAGDVLGHELTIDGSFYTPVDGELLATGEILSVDGTAFDFRDGRTIGSRMAVLSAPGGIGGGQARGYDHNWVVRGAPGELHDVGVVRDPGSGRVMRLSSTEPGVQIYTAGDLNADVIGKGGVPYVRYAGLALETQKFPCSPNFSHFPTSELQPGQLYRHRMVFTFSTDAHEGPW